MGLGSIYLQQEKPALAHIHFERAVQLQAQLSGHVAQCLE